MKSLKKNQKQRILYKKLVMLSIYGTISFKTVHRVNTAGHHTILPS